MTNLVELLKQNNVLNLAGKANRGSCKKLDANESLKQQVYNSTSFLPTTATLPQRLFCITHEITTLPMCSVCGVVLTKFNNTTGWRSSCSASCAQKDPNTKQRIKEVNNQRYGQHPAKTKEFKEKQHQTNQKRYGGHPLQNQLVRQKIKLTNLQKYGVQYHQQSDIGKQSREETNLQKYGVPYRFQSTKIQAEIKALVIEKYGVTSTAKLEHVKQKATDKIKLCYENPTAYQCLNDRAWLYEQHITLKKTLTEIAFSLKLKDEKSISTKLKQFNIPVLIYANRTSCTEREIVDFISQLNINFSQSDRVIIAPKELDIFLPELNVAIEYCGLYWHNDDHKSRSYHYQKWSACKQQGIRLLTIFEDEWLHKQDIVKSKLLDILQKSIQSIVYARKTTIAELTSVQKRSFFDTHHIQGDGPGSITYGLMYETEIVAAITFIKNKNNCYTLNRYATSCKVPGGFSKLLKHFTKLHEWNQIVTFADLRWSEGKLYQQTGFALDKILPPDYSYVIGNQRHHKFNFRHKHLAKKLVDYDPTLSETENMEGAGIPKIWNCGLMRFVLTKKY